MTGILIFSYVAIIILFYLFLNEVFLSSKRKLDVLNFNHNGQCAKCISFHCSCDGKQSWFSTSNMKLVCHCCGVADHITEEDLELLNQIRYNNRNAK